MFIEAYHKGNLIKREFIRIPDFKEMDFKNRAEAREDLVKLFLADFKINRLTKDLSQSPHLEIFITFESAMEKNEKIVKEEPAIVIPIKTNKNT